MGFIIVDKRPDAFIPELIEIAQMDNILDQVDQDWQNHVESADGIVEDEFCPAYDPFGYPASLKF